MPVTIYLRAIKHGRNYHLAMFDSNREGATDGLTTTAYPGNTIYWKKDTKSGIREIKRIYSVQHGRVIFKHDPIPAHGGFKLPVKLGINKGHKKPIIEKYFIECILIDDNTLLKIDPFIKIPPPPTNN